MNINQQNGIKADHLDYSEWDICIFGKKVDHRTEASINFSKDNSVNHYEVNYLSSEFSICINDEIYDLNKIESFCSKVFTKKSILIECTSLNFAEILLFLKNIISLGCSISLLYLEPKIYKQFKRTDEILHKRDFDLSERIPGFQAIPGFGLMLSDKKKQKGLFFLGFEPARLERSFEEFQMINPRNCDLVFGVPAFKIGWEMDSFANNINAINERNISGAIYYCGANNPLSAIDIIKNVYDGLSQNETLFISPIGTKPAAIGTAIFCSKYPEVKVLYDHPIIKTGRTNRVSIWNLYEIL